MYIRGTDVHIEVYTIYFYMYLHLTYINYAHSVQILLRIFLIYFTHIVAVFISPFDDVINMRESDWSPESSPRQFCLMPTNATRDYLRRDVSVNFIPSNMASVYPASKSS